MSNHKTRSIKECETSAPEKVSRFPVLWPVALYKAAKMSEKLTQLIIFRTSNFWHGFCINYSESVGNNGEEK